MCAFFIESGMSVAGVLLPPAGYLASCYEAVRAAGGVCVADEVQTGLGRFGTCWRASSSGGGEPLAGETLTARVGPVGGGSSSRGWCRIS